MSRKQIGLLVGAVLLAVIAPLFTLALLHGVGGTARADEPPPATYWKVSMPDLGQHSTGWCWVAAAADSFWWYADNVQGQAGLLGSIDKPWKAIDPASTTLGSVCGNGGTWFDSRDPADGAAILGYATVLKKIAETTFKDKVQDGVRDADGVDNFAGNADDEVNYCYNEGVEKWDYLIGLRDYVKGHGSNLKVHDIIDPAKCPVLGPWGYKVDRTAPNMNSRNPCGPGASGVPGVTQVQAPPAFMDYQIELSRSQDVLLWMEPDPFYSEPETAHVVTGVGYNQAGGVFGLGTITISDPWTHTTNPPLPPVVSASHTDVLLPAPLGYQVKPDHNTSPNHGVLPATEPYNLCDITQQAPLKIQCYNEDPPVTPQKWSVVDMIFVSPASVGGLAELPDVSGSSGANNVLLAGLASAGVAAVIAGAWYAKRRWER